MDREEMAMGGPDGARRQVAQVERVPASASVPSFAGSGPSGVGHHYAQARLAMPTIGPRLYAKDPSDPFYSFAGIVRIAKRAATNTRLSFPSDGRNQ